MSNTNSHVTPAGSALALAGSFREVSKIATALERASREAHLVSPATSVGSLPEGFEVALSSVLVTSREVYPIPGSDKVGLSLVALDRIAMAAGVSWDPVLSR